MGKEGANSCQRSGMVARPSGCHNHDWLTQARSRLMWDADQGGEDDVDVVASATLSSSHIIPHVRLNPPSDPRPDPTILDDIINVQGDVW